VDLARENWQIAFLLALGLHVALVPLSLVIGKVWNRPQPMPPIYTVRLFDTVDEPAARSVKTQSPLPPSSKSAESGIVAEKPGPSPQPVTASSPEVKATPPPAPVRPKAQTKKAVSLNPKEKTPPARLTRESPRPKPVTRKDQKDSAALLEKRLEALADKVETRRADAVLSQRLGAIAAKLDNRERTANGAETASPRAGGVQQPELLRVYCSEVWAAVRRHWILPEQLLDRESLVCVVVVQIGQDGSVLKAWFEHKSGFAIFDQSALRAVQEASPMPPLPAGLQPGPLEIGIRFKPGEVGM